MGYGMSYLSMNGRIIAEVDATISVKERGFRYGDGVFESIAVRRGQLSEWSFHLKRLTDGLEALQIPYDSAALLAHCQQLIKKNLITDGALRLYISRGQGSRGYLPSPFPNPEPLVVIETMAARDLPTHPMILRISEYEKISPKALPVHLKLAQGVQSTLVKLEAKEHQVDDCLLLNAQGNICETSSANIFWLKGNVLYTPALECGVLEGATRHAILRQSSWDIKEVSSPIETLKQADAVFVTNSIIGARAVGRLEPMGYVWDSETITNQVNNMLDSNVHKTI